MKILLVDDDSFLGDMYASKFISCGHEIDTANSSSTVISKLQSGLHYDLIILDMVMPGTTGVELLNLIKKDFPKAITHSIFLSNQGQDEDIYNANEAGAIGYIIKAHSIPSEVVKTVEEMVAKYS